MGHGFCEGISAVRGLRPAGILTVHSDADLVETAAARLHMVMKRYRRNRWWFRVTARAQDEDEFWTLWAGAVASGTRTAFCCTIRARSMQGRPAGIDINFYLGGLREFGDVGIAGPGDRVLSVRVGIQEARRRIRRWPPVPNDVVQALLDELPHRLLKRADLRRSWLRALRLTLQPEDGATWWVDPGNTPIAATRFVLLLYLYQAQMIDLVPDGTNWRLIREFLDEERRATVDDVTVYQMLQLMRRHFSHPQDWKGLRLYIGRVLRAIRFKERDRRSSILDSVDLSPRTAYRLMEAHKLPRIRLQELGRPTVGSARKQMVEAFKAATSARFRTRALRREASSLLEAKGRTSEAARKFLYRRLQGGRSLEEIVGRLRRGRNP